MSRILFTYERLQVDDLFSYLTTISKNLIKDANTMKSNLKSKLKSIFKLNGGVFTSDMWTDNYRKISYISFTIHYIEDWQLKKQVLAASKFPELKYIAENIKKTILSILKSYDLVSDITMKKYTFVIDSAFNYF